MPENPTASVWTKNWQPQIDLNNPAGQTIQEIARLIPTGSRVTLFGSAPLQLCFDGKFLSADVDCFGEPELKTILDQNGMTDKKRTLYVQVCSELNFRTSPKWKDRAHQLSIEERTFIIPHPIDILIGKIHRIEEKDLKAFRLVKEKTGHPTEEELIHELQNAVDLFRPGFDEENASDLKANTRILWQEIFQKDIDVSEVIIRPALLIRKEGYTNDISNTQHKAILEQAENERETINTIPTKEDPKPSDKPPGREM